MAWLRRWLGVGDSPKGVPTHCLQSGSPRGEHLSWGGIEGPTGGVRKSGLPWGLWGWMRSCKGDTSSQAEKLVPVNVYWTPFGPGLFTVARLQPAGGAGGLQRPCSCSPPLLPSRSSVGCSEKAGGWVEGRGWRLIISPTHLGPSPSPQSLPEIPQSSCPTDRSCPALGQPPRGQSSGRLRVWCVPVGHATGCPAPRAVSGGCSGPRRRPVLHLRTLLGRLPIAGV